MNAKIMRNYYDMFAIMFNSQKSYRKYIDNTHLGLLTETHEVLLRLFNTPNIHIFKMAAPNEDHFCQFNNVSSSCPHYSKRPQWVGF